MIIISLTDSLIRWLTHLFPHNTFRRKRHRQIKNREIVVVENIRLVGLLDLTSVFGVENNAQLTPIFKLQEKSKTGIQSCLYTVTLTPIFA